MFWRQIGQNAVHLAAANGHSLVIGALLQHDVEDYTVDLDINDQDEVVTIQYIMCLTPVGE